jgi:hypothetical protein
MVKKLTNSKTTSLSLVKKDGLWVDTSTGYPRILVPDCLQRRVVMVLHNVSHPGIRGTHRSIQRYFVFPRMNSVIKECVNSCMHCAHAKTSKHLKPLRMTFSETFRRFSTVHVDLVGPIPSSQNRYILTMADRATRWVEAIPIASISAVDVAKEFVKSWVARFGVPATVISDRGAQFTSDLWSNMCSRLGVNHRMTTSYHPQSNGLLERWHRRLKDALRASTNSESWEENLALVLLHLRNQPNEDVGVAPAQAVYGLPLTLPGTLLDVPDLPPMKLSDIVHPGISSPPRVHDQRGRTAIPPGLEFVYIKNENPSPLVGRYQGPYRVLRQSRNTVRIQRGDKEDTINIERVKPYKSLTPPEQLAIPPRRGRPRKPTGTLAGEPM